MRLEPIFGFNVERGFFLKGFEVLKSKKGTEEDLESYFLKASSSVDFALLVKHYNEAKDYFYLNEDFYYRVYGIFNEFPREINLFFNCNLNTLDAYAKEIKEIITSLEREGNGRVKICVFLEVTEKFLSKDQFEVFKKAKEVLGEKKIIIDDFGRGISNFDLLNKAQELGITGIKIDLQVIPFNVSNEIAKHLNKVVKNNSFLVVLEKVEEEKTLTKFIKKLSFSERDVKVRFGYQGFVFKKNYNGLFLEKS